METTIKPISNLVGTALKELPQTLPVANSEDHAHVCCICGAVIILTKDDLRRFENSANLKCGNCSEFKDRADAEAYEQAKADALERRLELIPAAFLKTDREKLPQPEKLDAALRWNFGDKGLLLFGPSGSGKSRVAWEVIKREVERGRSFQFVTAFSLAQYPSLIMAGDGIAMEFADRLARCDLLFLDDVFKAKPTERVEELLFAVVDERGMWGRPCIITLNDTGETLSSRLSTDRGPALIRRLREYCEPIPFK